MPALISSMTRSSRAREAASASNAGAEPRTAAPRLQRDVLRQRGERRHVLAQLRLLLHRAAGQQQGQRGEQGRDERHAEQQRLQAGGVDSVGHVVTMFVVVGPRLRRPRPA